MKMRAAPLLAFLLGIGMGSSIASDIGSLDASGSYSDNASSIDDSVPGVAFSSTLYKFPMSYLTGVRESSTGSNYCSGVLVAPKFVLTSCKCTPEQKSPGVTDQWVTIGSIYDSQQVDGEYIQVKKRHVHPKHYAKTGWFDFMLLELKTASTATPAYVAPFNYANVTAGASGYVYGWNDGGRYVTTTEHHESYQTSMTVGALFACLESFFPTTSEFCAMSNTQQDACHVNLGSPMIVNIGWKDTVVGIVSRRNGCLQSGIETGFSHVRLAQKWITRITGI